MSPIEKSTPAAPSAGEVNGTVNHTATPRQGWPSPEEQAALKAKIDALNPPRLELIRKECQNGLAEAELKELEQLQQEVGSIGSRLFPLPFEMLDKMKAVARREGLLAEEDT